MMVSDFDLIQQIDLLYEAKIVLYGAGKYGKELSYLLEAAGIEISYVCDSDSNKKLRNHKMITPAELKSISELNVLNIIIASVDYTDSILDSIKKLNIQYKNIFTYGGIFFAIQMNLDSYHFEPLFRELVRTKRDAFFNKVESDNCELMSNAITWNIMQYDSPGILVYTRGKVGSRTVFDSLIHNKIPALHFHENAEENQSLKQPLSFLADYIKNTNSEIKIITLVRDPISRGISGYMQPFTDKYIPEYALDFINQNVLKSVEKRLINLSNKKNPWEEFNWFQHIKDMTGVDVFQHEFDRKKGYQIIKQGKFKILLLKLETLNMNEKVIADFVECKDFKLKNSNMGSDKLYKYIYYELKKRMTISDEIIQRFYFDDDRINIFYTEDEINAFIKKHKKYGYSGE